MAFGKKKESKKKAQKEHKGHVVVTKVASGENVLYPPREESVAKEIWIALGTVVVSLVLVVIIVNMKSYAFGRNQYNAYQHTTDSSVTTTDVADTTQTGGEDVGDGAIMTEDQTQSMETTGDVIIVDRAGRIGDTSGIVTEEEPVTEAETSGDYILEGSDSRYISDSEIADLDKTQLSRARNEIYARHGRRFKDADLQSYFDSKPWYSGTIDPDDFSEGMLNSYEKANVEKIAAMEQAKGYR